ncbi:MAG: hypothetical protein ACI9LE_000510 [Paraglaciecola sp.]|jgi:hypothetical protein
MFFIQLFCKLSRVQLDPLEARFRPVKQPDKRTPRGTSGFGAYYHGCPVNWFLLDLAVLAERRH